MNKNGEWVYLNKESVLFSSSQFLEMPQRENSNLIGGKSMVGEYFKWKTRGADTIKVEFLRVPKSS